MAIVIKEVKTAFLSVVLENILKTLEEMALCKGHGMAYVLSYNIHQGKKALKDHAERLEVARNGFFEKDEKGNIKQFTQGEDGNLDPVGPNTPQGVPTIAKIPHENISEFNKMLKEFDEELLNVYFKPLDENKLNEALESSIFDGIGLTSLFDTLIN